MDVKEIKDVEVHLAKIDEHFSGLEKNLTIQFAVVNDSIKELKNNFVDRLNKQDDHLNKLELQKFSSSDFTQYRALEFIPLQKKVDDLEKQIELLVSLPIEFNKLETKKVDPLIETVTTQQKLIYIGMGITYAIQIGLFIYTTFFKR